MNILFAATFDVSHEYSAAFYMLLECFVILYLVLYFCYLCSALRISILFKARIRSF